MTLLLALCIAAAPPLVVIDPGHGGIDPGAERAGDLDLAIVNSARRKAGLSTSAGYHARPMAKYTADHFDAMVFVDFVYGRTFVVPVKHINLKKTYITFRNDSPWRNAWWALKQGAQSPVSI